MNTFRSCSFITSIIMCVTVYTYAYTHANTNICVSCIIISLKGITENHWFCLKYVTEIFDLGVYVCVLKCTTENHWFCLKCFNENLRSLNNSGENWRSSKGGEWGDLLSQTWEMEYTVIVPIRTLYQETWLKCNKMERFTIEFEKERNVIEYVMERFFWSHKFIIHLIHQRLLRVTYHRK